MNTKNTSNIKARSNTSLVNDINQKNVKTTKPKSTFRVIGLVVFLVIIGGILGSAYFFADKLAKMLIVNNLQSIVGAETNIDKVEVHWQPFGLTIESLQQTDPQAPSTNLFQFSQARAQLDLLELAVGHIIIDDLSVTHLQFANNRSHTGEVFVSETETSDENKSDSKQKDSQEEAILGSLEIPDAKTLLKDTDLITEQKGRNLKNVWDQESENLKTLYDTLPNESSLKAYEQQWKTLKSRKINNLEDINQLKIAINEFKDKLKQDKQAVAELKQQIPNSKEAISVAYKELKDAPSQDWQNIKQKLPIDDPNAMAISELVFGEEITSYLETAQSLYAKVKPYIDASQSIKKEDKLNTDLTISGRNIEFPLVEIWPSWLVKKLSISLLPPNSDTLYQLSIENMTSETYVRQQPITYQLVQADTEAQGDFKLQGDMYFQESGQMQTKGNWSISALPINNKALLDSRDLSLALTSATLTGGGQYQFVEQLSSKHNLQFQPSVFSGQSRTELSSVVVSTLEDINAFNMKVGINGQLDKPDLSIKSDLDNKISQSFKKLVKEKWQAVEANIQQGLEDKLTEQLNLSSSDKARFENMELSYKGIEKQLSQYGGDKLDSLVDEQKNILKQKAKAKLEKEKREAQAKLDKEKKEAQAKLEREKREAQAKIDKEKREAQAKLDEKKRQEEEKLKNKLKDKLKSFDW